MKTAQMSAQKWVDRAAVATSDYAQGVTTTNKDQSTRAIAAKKIYQDSLTASFARDAYAKGLAKSGQAGWKEGALKKGADRYAPGVSASSAKYAANSGKFDAARAASENMPRGVKGSPQNLNKVTTVVNALRAVKLAA